MTVMNQLVSFWQNLFVDTKLVNPTKPEFELRGLVCEIPYRYNIAIWLRDKAHLVIFLRSESLQDDLLLTLGELGKASMVEWIHIRKVTLVVDLTNATSIDVGKWKSIDTFTKGFNIRNVAFLSREIGTYVLLYTR